MVLVLKSKYRSVNAVGILGKANQLRIPDYTPEADSDNTAGLGISFTLSYLLVIFYSFFTAFKKTKVGSTVLTKGKYSLTISQAMYNSEKSITFLMVGLMTYLGIFMLYRKNFFQMEGKRIAVSVLFSIFPIIFIIFTYYGPRCKIHYLFASAIFIAGTVIQFLIVSLYKEYFVNEPILDTYESIVFTMIVFAVIITLILVSILLLTNIKNNFPKQIVWLMRDVLAMSEYTHLILYGILLYMFSTFAALPSIS